MNHQIGSKLNSTCIAWDSKNLIMCCVSMSRIARHSIAAINFTNCEHILGKKIMLPLLLSYDILFVISFHPINGCIIFPFSLNIFFPRSFFFSFYGETRGIVISLGNSGHGWPALSRLPRRAILAIILATLPSQTRLHNLCNQHNHHDHRAMEDWYGSWFRII